ncbi:MAG: hypothetical protein ABII27_06175 [bacterium]
MKKNILILVVIFLSAADFVFARSKAPVDIYDFDGGIIGARALGMGNSLTAVQGAAEASYWNPAALNLQEINYFTMCLDMLRTSRIETEEIFSSENLRGRKLTYIGFAGARGGIAFRPLANNYTEEIFNVNDPENNKSTKEIRINSFTLSVAQSALASDSTTSVGMNMSYLNGNLGITRVETGKKPVANISDGHGFSIDWGTLIKIADNILLGVMVQNIPGYIYWEDYDKTQLPIFLRGGMSYNIPGLITVSLEYEKRYYRDTDEKPKFIHIGAEQYLIPNLCLRGGIYGEDLNNNKTVNYTAGVGFNKDKYYADFGFRKYKQAELNNPENLEYVYQYLMSLGLPFGGEKQ